MPPELEYDYDTDDQLPEPMFHQQPNRSRTRSEAGSRVRSTHPPFTSEQRLLMLDTWLRSKLPAKDFAAMVGVSQHTLYSWKKRFQEQGPAGLEDKPKGGPRGSRMSEATRRAVMLMKELHPDWGCERIHMMLLRTQGLSASAGAIAKVLKEEGYESEPARSKPHPDKVRHFERARPNQLWQTDLFTFMLKRQNRRVYLVAFMDDHSRFIVSYGLHSSASGALVREVFESGITNFGAPTEVLTDNGTQYHTWRGKSAFRKLCERRGIKQIVARPRHPQTLGKIERFWGTIWRECVEEAVFQDLDDARRRVGLFIDYYNFQRTHQGIGGLVPADRFFQAAPQVLQTLRERVAENSAELARHGVPRKNVYLTGRVGDVGISLHSEGDEVILTTENGVREVVDLKATGKMASPGQSQVLPEPLAVEGTPRPMPSPDPVESSPGTSPLDDILEELSSEMTGDSGSFASNENPESEVDNE